MPTQTAQPMAPPARSFLPTAKNGVDPGIALLPCVAPDDGQIGDAVDLEAALHPCAAYPDLYPDETPPLSAGSIHAYAGMFLHDFVASCLQDRNAGEPFAVEFDVPLYRAPRDYVVPDVYAYTRLRQPRGSASTYHLKHDGAPDLVVEIISPSTWGKDVGLGRHTQLRDKKAFYRDIGVTEYWIYDPEGRRKDKTCLFEGFRWTDGDYQRIEPDASGRWPSTVLQTHWTVGPPYTVLDGRQFPLLRLLDPATNGWYLTSEERKALIAEQAALLAQYKQRFGPLDIEGPPRR